MKNYNVSDEPVTEVAVDINDIKDTSKEKGRNEECVFLVAGRMIYRKGLDFLFDALMRIPQETRYQVRVVGDGPELEHLRKRCKDNLNLSEHVHCMGSIPYMEMEKEYADADVFIMPSIRETTGTVLLEAMSKGIPVITINKFGGATLFDKDTGWLYEGNSKEEYIENLKKAILECIANPDEVREFLSLCKPDTLAIGIGNAHGYYRGTPDIHLEILEAVRKFTDIPLVLHGCTGMADSIVKEAIKLGVAKINFGTEIRYKYVEHYKEALEKLDYQGHSWKLSQYASDALTEDVKKIIELSGSAGTV